MTTDKPTVTPLTAERKCLERLADPDGFKAVCDQANGTEHSHHDTMARGAVTGGVAHEYDPAFDEPEVGP